MKKLIVIILLFIPCLVFSQNKSIIIPKEKVNEFTVKLDKYNEVVPIELKDGTFFINENYLKPESMVNPDACKQKISELTSKITKDKFIKKELNESDYKEAELIEQK